MIDIDCIRVILIIIFPCVDIIKGWKDMDVLLYISASLYVRAH